MDLFSVCALNVLIIPCHDQKKWSYFGYTEDISMDKKVESENRILKIESNQLFEILQSKNINRLRKGEFFWGDQNPITTFK